MRSLAIKLTVAFLIVSVLGTALVALLVNWQTQRQFGQYVNDLYWDDMVDLSDQLALYYQETGGWQGVKEAVIYQQPESPGYGDHSHKLPITLLDDQRKVVFGGPHYQPGQQLPISALEKGIPIQPDGETVGWVLLDSFDGYGEQFPESPEINFLANVNEATVFSTFGAAVFALLLGIFLARTISYPMSELKEATRLVAQGQLGHQVAVRSKDEIGQLAASFNQMSADLAHSNELRRQMTADIAHDLRTPLSVIQGYTEALDEGKLPGNSEIYGAMHKQVKHLTRLVEDLRTLSLADAGQLPLWRQAVDPRDLLEHSALVYMTQVEQQGVTLHLDVSEKLPRIEVDSDRMVQVLGNLLTNALRYTPAGGQIQMAAATQDHTVLLKVQDTGAGIAPEDLPHVFDRFYRADKSRSFNGESGLGLAIARSIVEAHGGKITVESVLTVGTTFFISLPVAP